MYWTITIYEQRFVSDGTTELMNDMSRDIKVIIRFDVSINLIVKICVCNENEDFIKL